MRHKPFKTLDEQLAILKARGLKCEDDKAVLSALAEENYYRISGYMLTFKKNDDFLKGTTFSNILDVYHFDRELRLFLLGELEKVEISLRTHIAYELGRSDTDPEGKLSYMQPETFASEQHFIDFMSDLKDAHKNCGSEAFVKHHDAKYGGILPVWAMVETLSFGTLSRMYESLNIDIKKQISTAYYNSLRYSTLDNFFEGLVVLRNACAHHSRLYNRGFIMSPSFSSEEISYFRNQGYYDNEIGKRLFFRLVVLAQIFLDPTKEAMTITNEIKTLQQRYPSVDIKYYGFKKNWEEIFNNVVDKKTIKKPSKTEETRPTPSAHGR